MFDMAVRLARRARDARRAGVHDSRRGVRGRGLIGAAVVLASGVTIAGRAAAYTIETQVTRGCHESITGDALRQVRAMGLAPPLASTEEDDDPLIGDVPFHTADDEKDLGAVSLVLGVRDNDVKDLSATALDQLAQLTAEPAGQREHCLRSDVDKEPGGTKQAVADCRAFIKERLVASLEGLGADGKPDGHLRQPLTVTLALRGKYTVSVPRFYVRAGQAIHAIQDSFTHTFRDPKDPHKITVTLDWIDYASNKLDEPKDGPPHMTALDRCDDPDDLRKQKHQLAIEASAAALQVALDPTLTAEAKAAGFDKMLDTYISYEDAKCSAANAWCDAAENQYRPSGCGCGVAGAGGGGLLAASGLAALTAMIVARRRARERTSPARGKRRHVAAASLALLTCAFAPRLAAAQETSPLPEAPEHAPQGPVAALSGDSQSAKPGMKDPAGSKFLHASIGGSYDNAALAFTLGGKYQLSQYWMLGGDVEWNPWLPRTPFSFRAGTGNVYASLVRRYQMAYEAVNFRTTVALGLSTLLMDLPGANKWSLGPIFGISFLGVEWKLAPGYFLVVDPTYIIIDAPHLTGTPLVYYQYRFQVGLEFGG